MKYIEKHSDAPEVVSYEKELKEGRLDRDSLRDSSVHPALNGAGVYDMVRDLKTFPALKNRMFADQGGICCYCGCRLEYPNHPQYIVEHVFPKEHDRTKAGEYDNMLLSCRPSSEEEEKRKAAAKKERRMFFHCDKSKESKVLGHTPLQKDCQDFFRYDEFGGVDGLNETAQKDVEVLNLGCDWLRTRRMAAINGEILDEEGKLLDDEQLRHRLESIMLRNKDGQYAEYCFVIYNVISNLLAQPSSDGANSAEIN